MNAPFIEVLPRAAETALATSFPGILRVTVLFDDFGASQRAFRTLSRMADEDLAQPILQPTYWSFNLLENPGLRARAAQNALGADLLVVSAGQENVMPRSVERLIDVCATVKARRGLTLVLLFGCDEPWTLCLHGNPDPAGLARVSARSTLHPAQAPLEPVAI